MNNFRVTKLSSTKLPSTKNAGFSENQNMKNFEHKRNYFLIGKEINRI